MISKSIHELRAALQRFIASHFDGRMGSTGEKARFSIPARRDHDDDLVLGAAIDELEALRERDDAARKASAVFAQWVKSEGDVYPHDDGCPQDPTCRCALHAAVNALCRIHETAR